MIKGSTHTPATRRKIAKTQTKYLTADLISGFDQYLEKFSSLINQIPTIAGLSHFLGCSRQTIYTKVNQSPELQKLFDRLNDLAEDRIINNGLTDKFNAGFSQFLLKTKYGYHEQGNNSNTINVTNINPDLLKEALAIK